jgi:patatin-related protein
MCDPEAYSETRFAVVMYGGVSLAIYINGIAQELYRMVDATATKSPGTDADSGSENVYKTIAGELKTRFVVDIISGTSAGGINGIFLAKALANGQPIKSLEQMWLDEGDIEVLINDRKSKNNKYLPEFDPPKSLLNSKRMYDHLLDAFNEMDKQPKQTPLVKELDLYVTTTDLQGIRTPLRLADEVVWEKKHQNIFHFQLKNDNASDPDFAEKNNPFLAFAARCTSAFPFAFEPMCFKDIQGKFDDNKWKRFCDKYLMDPALCDKDNSYEHVHNKIDGKYDLFTQRAFADGGSLDNKPFSYAINAIASRGSDVPIARKLIYIEPSPDEPPPTCAIEKPPNAIENVVKVFSLALYETIQQDLQRVIDRNRLIERINRILKGTTDDIAQQKMNPYTAKKWYKANLKEMIHEEGIAYGGYLRLRVAQLTDDIAEIISKHARFDVESDYFLAVRYLVRAWRDSIYHYYDHSNDTSHKGGKENFNQFLFDYDLGFMIRRISYTISIIDSTFPLIDVLSEKKEAIFLTKEERYQFGDYFSKVVEPLKTQDDLIAFRKQLQKIRKFISERREYIYNLQEKLLKDNEFTKTINEMNISPQMLNDIILDKKSDSASCQAAGKFIRENDKKIKSFEKIAEIIHKAVKKADLHSSQCKVELGLSKIKKNGERDHAERGKYEDNPIPLENDIENAPKDPVQRAQWMAATFFRRFMWYDEVVYPIIQFSGVGKELDEVEIIRISPTDADSLSPYGVDKLGGATLMHFGAFLDRTWRKNDILWGRLDGAERIIKALLLGTRHETKIKKYVRDAHLAIIKETFFDKDPTGRQINGRIRSQETMDLLVQLAIGKTDLDKRNTNEKISKNMEADAKVVVKKVLTQALNGHITPDIIYKWLNGYKVNRDINPRLAMESITRSTQVFGKMLEAISAQYRSLKRPAALISTFGSFAWGVVEAALPNSLFDLVTRKFSSIITLLAVILIAGGMFFNESNLKRYGLWLLFGAAGFSLIKFYLRQFLQGKKTCIKWTLCLLFLILAVVIICMIVIVVHYFPDVRKSILDWWNS